MAMQVRGRLAIASGSVLFASLVVYATVARSVHVTGERERHRRDEEASLIRDAERLSARIINGYAAGESLTIGEGGERAPLPAPILRALADDGFVWMFDRRGFLIYNSTAVQRLSADVREYLSESAETIAPGASLSVVEVGPDSGVIRRVPLSDTPIHEVPLEGRPMLQYSHTVEYRAAGVRRVVVGRLRTPPPRSTQAYVLPFFVVLPLIALAAFGSAALYARIALAPTEARVDRLISEVTAITDGRSLHRRLPTDAEAGAQFVQLATTLNAMLGRLETSFAALRRFTADASHELKTPLTVLRADVERAMALGSSTTRDEQLEALEEALAETTRMADLVDSLLTLARADEGRFDLHREPVDLEALAKEVFETALLLGERTRINVRMPPPARVTVLGDRARLRQLFLNLVTNAIKYTPADGSVELDLSVSGATASFTVRDSGIGIAAADIPRVFERFWRADPARSRGGERGGVGLGLAISHYIAQAHGGSLTVSSRLGRGSTFTVSLPVPEPSALHSVDAPST